MDIVIISAQNASLADFWKNRLSITQQALGIPKILVVPENWPGGAGNALGTLYAYQQAQKDYGIDLDQQLNQGASIGLYHTAGEGRRLYPLTACEGNNKSALRLPGFIQKDTPITLLEAIIKQTTKYAPVRKGRLSVFWGDQLFFPSSYSSSSQGHVDILVKAMPPPNAEEWQSKRLQHYGFFFKDAGGKAFLLEKGSYAQFERCLDGKKTALCGISLGSFSLSKKILRALLDEFQPELSSKKGKMDTDLHWWMAALMDLDLYVDFAKSGAKNCFERMQSVKGRLNTSNISFEGVDIGKESPWCDLGTTEQFYTHLLRMAHPESQEGQQLRQLLNYQGSSSKNSILINVEADEIDVEDSILIDVKAPSIKARGALMYHAVDAEKLLAGPGEILSTINGKHYRSRFTRNPKDDWDLLIEGNPLTWSDLYQTVVRVSD